MEEKSIKVNEKAGIQFSLTFLIQVLGTVIVAVWGYSQLDARISQVQNETATHKEQLRGIELELKENQDKPIPSDYVQNTTLVAHEKEIGELRSRIKMLESYIYAR